MAVKSSKPYEAGSSFKPAFFFLSPEQRRALSAFYGFARAVDDIADDPAMAPEKKSKLLAAWRERIDSIYAGGKARNALERELSYAITAFPIKAENFILLMEGVSMDITRTEYATFEELRYYMYRVASAVGFVCLEIFGWHGHAARIYAENLGYAVQLTNIIRDVFEDARSGRTYIPLEDLKRFKCSAGAIQNSIYPDNFIELMRFEAGRAKEFYAKAAQAAKGQETRKLLAAFVMAEIYRSLLNKIESQGFMTAETRIRLNGLEKIKAIYSAWRRKC